MQILETGGHGKKHTTLEVLDTIMSFGAGLGKKGGPVCVAPAPAFRSDAYAATVIFLNSLTNGYLAGLLMMHSPGVVDMHQR